MLLAGAVAVLHGAIVVFLLCGALLALRWPRVAWVHAPIALFILGVNILGAACPLTRLELWLRGLDGVPGYTEGYLGHYFFGPLGIHEHSTTTQLVIYTLALLPNVIGYSLLAARAVGRRRQLATASGPAPAPGTPQAP